MNDIKKDFSEKIFTVPNVLSFFRILLVPVFVICYFCRFNYHIQWAFGVFVVSGFSDVLDGFIARKFNMISTLGKVLDPVADKLTQGCTLICISIQHPVIMPLLILLVAKEATMFLGSYRLLKMGYRPSEAKWWGKLGTVVMFLLVITVFVCDMFSQLPRLLILIMEVIAAICQLFSLFNYYPVFKDIQSGAYKFEQERNNKED